MNFIIIGSGRMGSGIARALSLQGHTLAVIDQESTALQRLGTGFKGKRIVGHGMDRAILGEAGITSADGVAAVTGNDNLNTIVALMARQHFHVPKVVARLYDPLKAETYRRLGVITISPTTWGVTRVCEQLIYPRLNTIATLGDGAFEIVEMEIPVSLVGRTIADLTMPQQLHVVALRREGRTFLASQTMQLQADDVAYVAASSSAISHLNAPLGIV
jgi:trk system potassium uptake protein TrkA